MRPSDINKLLERYNLKAKKHLGQNFLSDQNYINKIVDSASIDKNTAVIEIGPGLGSLTQKLVEKAGFVLCYEIDSDMANIIKDTIEAPNLVLINQDFLRANVFDDIKEYLGQYEEIILVANLPYYITTAILIKILEDRLPIKKMIVMMQKEVADRLSGNPKTKEYNSLSVLVQYYTNVKRLFDVAPDAFIPRPEVVSTVLELEKKISIETKPLNEEFFLKFNRLIFSSRRKTISNNIAKELNIDKKIIAETLVENGFRADIRAEALSVADIIKLSDLFYQIKKED
jgi:16S rRNA (adenine1518-N6/adenine1519-N6)-dimethyltransferase